MSATASPVIARVVDRRYRVEEHLAQGGMASVYRARDLRLDRDVALKVLHPELARDPEFVTRFEREARSVARLSHPHVVSVFDQGQDDGLVFLAMELVEAGTLREVIARQAPLSVREVSRYLDPVLQALAAAHHAGLVHRDVKPENVLLHPSGTVKVADFGLARAVGTDATSRTTDLLWGTAAYLAPEQVELGRADARSDVYAAGLVLFELLTGRKAFPGDNALQVAYQHVHGSVPRAAAIVPTVPPQLERLIQWACATEPRDRPRDAGQLLAALRDTVRMLSEAELDADPRSDQHRTGAPARAGYADPEVTTRFEPTRRLSTVGPSAPGGTDGTYARTSGNRTAGAGRAAHPARRRRRRLGAPLGVLLLMATAGATLSWYYTSGPGIHSPMPAVAGLPETQAHAALDAAQLDAVVRAEHSETVPSGTVLSASHDEGEALRHGSDVEVVVSAGPERYAVPPLVGLPAEEAQQALVDANLGTGRTTEDHSEDVPAGEVISASAQEGALLKPGTAVDLVVSAGPEPIEVTSVVGEPLDEATGTLREAGFEVAVDSERVFHSSVPDGAVVAQTPSGGTGHRGDVVQLVVSKGQELVQVPALIGMQYTDAEPMLTDMGLVVLREDLAGGYFGTVRFQSVDPGESVPKGTEILLTVL